MSNNIASGIQNMDLNRNASVSYASRSNGTHDEPSFSPFPKLVNPPPNVPQSDEELEQTLENARVQVLNSNDPEVQLAWAADALVYVGVCMDHEERIAAARPQAARSTTPKIEHQLKQDAMNITTFLADQHHPKAEFLRGMWLEWGRFGQREDKREAFRCYSRAADRGYARAEYRIGMFYESYNEPAKALKHYNRGVEAGDAASCYRLGMMTLRGQHGQPQDFAKGLDLIRRSALAADENAAQGAYVYGMLLAKELPQMDIPDGYLQPDQRNARINIEKAAYLKFAKAQLKMGSAYELGSLGCEFNPALSMHYNALAAKQGEPEADMALSKWFLVGSEGLFPKNEELAYMYAERAAQSDLATAEFALGYFREIGVYVSVDLDKAMEWYIKAARHGNADAQGRIDGLERKQILNKKDAQKVAVQRIQSMHGSMRGHRPERFQQQPSRLAQASSPIMEEISSPSSVYSQAVDGTPFTSNYPPPRGSSITPYPEDDHPPRPPPEQRSQSVAPYPLEDGPPKPRLGPTGGFFNANPPPRPATTLNPDLRPSSAFQLSPDVRPNSTAAGPAPYPGRQPYPGQMPWQSAGGPPPAQRPATTQPHDPRLRPGPAPRVSSGPPGSQNYPPYQPAPLQARPPMPAHQATAPHVPPQQPQQKLDIGFSAPVDDRRNRTYGPGPTRPNGTQGTAQPPPPKNTHSMPNFDQKPLPAHKAYGGPATTTSTATPAMNSSSRPGSSRPPATEAPRPPKKDQVPAASQTTAPKPATAGRPPGKGPKTFDEMGVPKQDAKGECVVM